MRLRETLVCIPFRDRGDGWRRANLSLVCAHLGELATVVVVDDGRQGADQFNRSAAYNKGVKIARQGGFSSIIFNEADMIVPYTQLTESDHLSRLRPGLVVPFSERHELSQSATLLCQEKGWSPMELEAENVYGDCVSMGAVNVVSMATMDKVGAWDETFEGAWYDDNAMFRAFEIASGQPRWVAGRGTHLWHMPTQRPDASEEDKAATERNKNRYENQYLRAQTPEEIRILTSGGALP